MYGKTKLETKKETYFLGEFVTFNAERVWIIYIHSDNLIFFAQSKRPRRIIITNDSDFIIPFDKIYDQEDEKEKLNKILSENTLTENELQKLNNKVYKCYFEKSKRPDITDYIINLKKDRKDIDELRKELSSSN